MKTPLFLLAGAVALSAAAGGAADAESEWRPLSAEVEIRTIRETAPLPQLIRVARIPRDRRNLRLAVLLGNRRVFGLETLPNMLAARRLPSDGKPAAAVNGDFFTVREDTNYTGTLRGITVADGEIITCPRSGVAYPWHGNSVTLLSRGWPDLRLAEVRPALSARLPDGTVHPFGVNGFHQPGQAMLYTPRLGLAPGEKPDAVFAPTTRTVDAPEVILSPVSPERPVVRFGAVRTMRVEAVRPHGNSPLAPDRYVLTLPAGAALPAPGGEVELRFDSEPDLSAVRCAISGHARIVAGGAARDPGGRGTRAPRTAVGFDDRYLYLLVADGRMAGRAAGLTFAELAGRMARLGAAEAMDLDGGGSSMLWAEGALRNELYTRPAVRRIANALAVLRVAPEPAQSASE